MIAGGGCLCLWLVMSMPQSPFTLCLCPSLCRLVMLRSMLWFVARPGAIGAAVGVAVCVVVSARGLIHGFPKL